MDIPAPLRQLPNQLTVARIVAVPVLCLFIGMGNEWLRWLALVLYVVAALTDWLDGFLARRMNMSSDLGKMLDPIADKLLVGCLIVTLAWTHDFSGLDLVPAIAILFREIFIAGLREFMGNRNVSVPVMTRKAFIGDKAAPRSRRPNTRVAMAKAMSPKVSHIRMP